MSSENGQLRVVQIVVVGLGDVVVDVEACDDAVWQEDAGEERDGAGG